jgi:hypothetical protein
LFYNQVFHIYLWWEQVYNHMINRVGKMCVATMSLCMIVLIVTRKRRDGRYYFALWQTNNNHRHLFLSMGAPSSLLLLQGAQLFILKKMDTFATCYFLVLFTLKIHPTLWQSLLNTFIFINIHNFHTLRGALWHT